MAVFDPTPPAYVSRFDYSMKQDAHFVYAICREHGEGHHQAAEYGLCPMCMVEYA